MDLRHDPKVKEELQKTSQKPVTEEQVCDQISMAQRTNNVDKSRATNAKTRSALTNIWNVPPKPTWVSERYSSKLLVPPCSQKPRSIPRSAWSCKSRHAQTTHKLTDQYRMFARYFIENHDKDVTYPRQLRYRCNFLFMHPSFRLIALESRSGWGIWRTAWERGNGNT